MTTLDAILESTVADPDSAGWLVLADWLEEQDDPRRAELVRVHRQLLASCCSPELHPGRPRWQARIVELLGLGVRPVVPRRTIALADGVEMAFHFIPPGSFLMGGSPGEGQQEGFASIDERRHRVTLTRGFWVGSHPVSQGQWQAVLGTVPGEQQRDDDLPVARASWHDCQDFCERLGARTGQRFALPTEAQWEYACRAGTTTPFHFGETLGTGQANYNGGYTYGRGRKGLYRRETTPVGMFPPNAWGLHDLHGNVWEWTLDGYGNYPFEETTDPCNQHAGRSRVLRGGSWYSSPGNCRSAYRHRCDPDDRTDFHGCRVLLCI
jgi:uncharacterized protein (TIGR02996 family)